MEDNASVGCLGCLALIVTYPFYLIKMALNKGARR